MLGLFKNKIRPIGLDIGHSAVKMVQFAVDGDVEDAVHRGIIASRTDANSLKSGAESTVQNPVCQKIRAFCP